MTIREMEQRTELPRASIRFYEREGLLRPRRGENGYRDYSEEDLALLGRIKLLRSVGVSVEQLREVQSGALPLTDALNDALAALEGQRKANDYAQRLCRAMLSDGADFTTLDVERYREEKTGERSVWDRITEAETPVFGHPWRRLLARCMDIGVYTLIWAWFMALARNTSITDQPVVIDLLMGGVVLVLMLVLEPLCLRSWGTTPGKWLQGLRVEDVDGGRPNYTQGLERTWAVIGEGLGYGFPVWSLICLWRSWSRCEKGTLSWEQEAETELVLIKSRGRRWILFAFGVVVHAMLLCGSIYAASHAQLPPNRGDLTIEQFLENYNYYCDYFGWEQEYLCLDEGKLCLVDNSGDRATERYDFSWREENGVVTGIYLLGIDTHSTLTDTDGCAHWRKEILCALSFAGAQKAVSLLRGERTVIADEICHKGLFDYELTLGGAKIQKNFQYEGFHRGESRLIEGKYFLSREYNEPPGSWRVDFAAYLPQE